MTLRAVHRILILGGTSAVGLGAIGSAVVYSLNFSDVVAAIGCGAAILGGFCVLAGLIQRNHVKETDLLLRGLKDVGYQLKQAVASSHAAALLSQRFADAYLPVSSFSMNPVNLMVLVDVVKEQRPKRVVEFGSGLSTMVIANVLCEQGFGKLTSLDHDPLWVERCNRALRDAGLVEWAEVFNAPLHPGTEWYDVAPETLGEAIDVLVIDGPPAGKKPDARLRVIDEAGTRLADGACIFVDDANRAGESRLIHELKQRYGSVQVDKRYSLTGAAVLRLTTASKRGAGASVEAAPCKHA